MPLDLTIADADNPDLGWLYAHATLQRLLHPRNDGRGQFINTIPGCLRVLSRASIQANNFNVPDLFLDHHLLELENGWVNVLGGTEGVGWGIHPFSPVEWPDATTYNFCEFWYALALICRDDMASVIPGLDNRRILFSGHSLGGATSVTAAFLEQVRRGPIARPVGVVSFGCPLARNKAGMDGQTFPHIRVVRDGDCVPSLPQNMLSVPLNALPIKSYLTGLRHYGTPVRLMPDNTVSLEDYSFLRYSLAGAALHFIGAFQGQWNPFRPHYMVSYAMHIRQCMQKAGYRPDAWFDQCNDFLNQVEGWTWNIPGFPRQAATPPASPAPAPVQLDVALKEDERIESIVTSSFIAPTPAATIIRNQSLAAFLSQRSGRDFRDVVIRLYTTPLADPTTAQLGDFEEAFYPGYQAAGGAEWETFAPTNYTTAKRFLRRCNFSDWSGAVANNIAGWYAVALEGATLAPVLIAWQQFGSPVAFDQPERGIFLEVELTAA